MSINAQREFLLNNYLESDIQKLFYPFSLLQHFFLSTKFIIRDNFIYSNGPKMKAAMSIFWAILFGFYTHRLFTKLDSLNNANQFFTNRTPYFLLIFTLVYNIVAIITVFIMNLVHNYNNILLILYIQTIHEHIKIEVNCKWSKIIWSWISSVAIICINVLRIVFLYVTNSYVDYAHTIVDYLLIIFDLNLLYAIRIMAMLRIYLIHFKIECLLTYPRQYCDSILNIYKILMQAYTLFNKIFNFMVIVKL